MQHRCRVSGASPSDYNLRRMLRRDFNAVCSKSSFDNAHAVPREEYVRYQRRKEH